MNDEPMIVKAEPLEDISLADSMKTIDELESLYAFLHLEWKEANEYLTDLGFPPHIEDEYGDKVFVKLEERIRMVVDGK